MLFWNYIFDVKVGRWHPCASCAIALFLFPIDSITGNYDSFHFPVCREVRLTKCHVLKKSRIKLPINYTEAAEVSFNQRKLAVIFTSISL